MIKFLFSFVALCFICLSCDLINPAEPDPSWLRIDSVSVNSNYATQGSSSSNITDVFLFVDGKLQGVHDLPLNTPLLIEGEHEISIAASIKRNGIGDLRIDYPFYTQFKGSANFTINDTTTIKPVVEYFSQLNYFIEDFEDPGIKLVSDFNSDTTIQITKQADQVFERTGSGIVNTDTTGTFFFIRTNEGFDFNLGQPVFAELNYNSDADFEYGIIANASGNRIPARIGFVRNTIEDGVGAVWKKIYFDLSTAINQNAGALSYDFYISGQSRSSGQKFIFDNLKIVYR